MVGWVRGFRRNVRIWGVAEEGSGAFLNITGALLNIGAFLNII